MFLDSETTIRIYYRLLGDKPIDAYTITIDGKAVEPTPEGDRYYVEIQDIGAHKLDEMHTITAGNETLIYGPMSYVYDVLTYDPEGSTIYNLALALYAYSAAAENYIK
jgi:hypothetical protein